MLTNGDVSELFFKGFIRWFDFFLLNKVIAYAQKGVFRINSSLSINHTTVLINLISELFLQGKVNKYVD